MEIKKAINGTLADSKILKEYRYNSAKIFFIGSSLLFFLNYFFVGARFNDEIFIKTLPFSYVLFLLGFCLYIYMLVLKFINDHIIYNIILGIVLGGIFVVCLLPIF